MQTVALLKMCDSDFDYQNLPLKRQIFFVSWEIRDTDCWALHSEGLVTKENILRLFDTQ